MGGLPAALRVPRSPAVFVGRERELTRAMELLARGGVVCISGLGGLGKTSLACRVVEQLGATSTALLVEVPPGADLVLQLGRTLARAEGFATADWSAFASDPTAMLDAVIDLAEASERLVVVDDLHDAAEGSDDVLGRIARCCRRSRWVVTSRRPPTWPGSEEQVVSLQPLNVEEVESLLAACAPALSAADRHAVAREAAGSPWLARARLRGSSGSAVLTEGLQGPEVELLTLLAAVNVAVPAPLLLQCATADERSLETLGRHGYLGPGMANVRLHDVARAQLERGLPPPSAERLVAFSAALWASGLPELELEAISLARRHAAEHAELLSQCAAHVESWIEAGLAERALAVLDGVLVPAAFAARLACAAVVGTDDALAFATRAPEPAEAEGKRWWAVAQERAGQLTVAARASRDVRKMTEDPDLAARAGLVEASALRASGHTREAELVLTRLAPLDRGLRVLVEARHASILALVGRVSEALAESHQALEQASHLPPGPRLDVITTVQAMLNSLGHLSEARALTKRIEAERIRAPFASRQQIAFRCIDALEAGELAEGRRWLDHLGPTRGSLLHVHALLDDLRWRGAIGRFDGLEETLAELFDVCEATANTEGLAWARLAEAFFGLVLGSTTLSPWPDDLPRPREQLDAAMNAWVRIVQRRRDLHVAPLDVDSPIVDISIFLRRDACESLLMKRDSNGARRSLTRLIDQARRYGFHLHLADLLALGIDLNLADPTFGDAGRRGARRHARDLAALAAHMGSDRYAMEAELGALLAGDDSPSADQLAEFAAARSVSPIVARRARGLIGDAAGLDAVDRLVLGSRCVADTRVATSPDAGWRFDAASRCVLLPARVIDLQKHGILVRLLATLVGRGDSGASKEELTRAVWELRDYHPLRDDKRLQVAVRRLRVMLEEDAERPRRLVTTGVGYAVRGLASPEPRMLPRVTGP